MRKILKPITWLLGAVWLSSTCAYGQSNTAINFQNATFESHGDFVYCGAVDYGFTDQLSVSAWVKWTMDPSNFSRSTKHSDREGYYATYVAMATHNTLNRNDNVTTSEHGQFWLRNTKTGNNIEFTVENISGTKATVTSTTNPEVDTWYFLTGTYDGSSVKLYLDAVLEDETAQTGNIRANTDCRLNMGRLPWGYGFFVGYLDEVRVWDAALSLTEIQDQKNSKPTIRDADCLSYWNFDAGSGTTITDSKGLASGTYLSALLDVHGSSTDLPNRIIEDEDKTFATGAWNGRTMVTVAGAGIGETNVISSNTGNVFTLQNSFSTTPVIDGTTNMTWFGILAEGETSQWVIDGDFSLPVCLGDLSATRLDSKVMISWFTESEVENLGFILERRHSRLDAFEEIVSFLSDPDLQGQGSTTRRSDYTYLDNHVFPGASYEYRLSDVDYHNKVTRHPIIQITVKEPALTQLPHQETLLEAYPNPFNPSTTIQYKLPEAGLVSIWVYDVNGNLIKDLSAGLQTPGTYSVTWSGDAEDGKPLHTGIYIARLVSGDHIKAIKLLLLK